MDDKTCNCKPGFVGDNCEINLCDLTLTSNTYGLGDFSLVGKGICQDSADQTYNGVSVSDYTVAPAYDNACKCASFCTSLPGDISGLVGFDFADDFADTCTCRFTSGSYDCSGIWFVNCITSNTGMGPVTSSNTPFGNPGCYKLDSFTV